MHTRVGLLAGLLLLVVGSGVVAESPPPTPLYAPDDLASLLPRQVDGLELDVYSLQGAEVGEAVSEMDDVAGLALFHRILAPLAEDPDGLHFAAAVGPGRNADTPRAIVAMRVVGVTGDALLDHLSQAEAEMQGVEVPTDWAWPTLDIDGRTVMSYYAAEDTDWYAYYPKGEVLFMAVVVDGPSMRDVIAALP